MRTINMHVDTADYELYWNCDCGMQADTTEELVEHLVAHTIATECEACGWSAEDIAENADWHRRHHANVNLPHPTTTPNGERREVVVLWGNHSGLDSYRVSTTDNQTFDVDSYRTDGGWLNIECQLTFVGALQAAAERVEDDLNDIDDYADF